jgi:hypothetical protein
MAVLSGIKNQYKNKKRVRVSTFTRFFAYAFTAIG